MSWISNISTSVNNALSSMRKPLAPLPPLLLLCESAKRPGLSAMALTAAVIRRLPEIGIETGVNVDGTQNKILQFIRVFSEEIVNEIKTNMKVTCSLGQGTILSIGTGANAGGPMTVTSTNATTVSADGISQ